MEFNEMPKEGEEEEIQLAGIAIFEMIYMKCPFFNKDPEKEPDREELEEIFRSEDDITLFIEAVERVKNKTAVSQQALYS